MVYCCIPSCNTISDKCDPSITFQRFPSNPNCSTQWIKQINNFFQSNPPWFPRGNPVVCSKHFLQTDFLENTDILKVESIPTVFGNTSGLVLSSRNSTQPTRECKKTPLILKLIKREPHENVFRENSEPQITSLPLLSPNRTSNQKIQTITSTFEKGCRETNNKNSNSPCHLKTRKLDSQDSHALKKSKKSESSNDLIEIGPNTFLKINPNIIKVNKKLSPSGNTVLQFIMDQKIARPNAGTIFQSSSASLSQEGSFASTSALSKSASDHTSISQGILGHLVDTHVCQETCDNQVDENQQSHVEGISCPIVVSSHALEQNLSEDSNALQKAPVLMTTNMPFSHCFMEKPRYLMLLKQKSRQIASLKFKLSSLQKKIEELEDLCIVQERQLSYSFIKQLKTIRKNASKGDPCATYILEQIRCYAGNTKVHWSASTLSQCAVWCRKAPYAYEYFKKADFFKLPCLGTVKRFMKKHPELKFRRKPVNVGDDDSSSDFDFDDSDGESPPQNNEEEIACEISRDLCNENLEPSAKGSNAQDTVTTSSSCATDQFKIPKDSLVSDKSDVHFPILVDGTNLELQEIILPSGEIVQCYSSTQAEAGNQYYIIPNANATDDHEYNVVPTDAAILGNSPLQQEQLIFITNSGDQVECTEVISG